MTLVCYGKQYLKVILKHVCYDSAVERQTEAMECVILTSYHLCRRNFVGLL